MDDDQQFCLRWNNHQSTLVSVFDTLLVKEIHVDCTLAAEGRTLKAHKVVLSACSPYFESVLSEQFDKHPIIILKDVKFAELRAMMDYMYRGEVNISQDQLAALLKAAESLQIKGLSDNKPSRPPSRPPPAPAHPPRAPSPPPQTRDGSSDSRSGSLSPSRRRKKARRTSSPVPPAGGRGRRSGEPPCKEELARDVEDLTLDDAHTPPADHNDVVRNFQWHMERSQDEIMNSNDSVRENQEPSTILTSNSSYNKTPFPLTRGYLKHGSVEDHERLPAERGEARVKRAYRRRLPGNRKYKKSREDGPAGGRKEHAGNERRYLCSICKKKQYKYRRNKLRHEKYECVTGPQFACQVCGKRYSQKKTLTMHIAQKHDALTDSPLKHDTAEHL
nr:protein tramtrack, beta isoform-like isoform X2 [Danaus plexippus plexippus]